MLEIRGLIGGGYSGSTSKAGIMFFDREIAGGVSNGIGFRIVIAP